MSTEDALGAEEVATKEFPVTFRGFGQHDVRAFLAQVAAELAAARERERLQRERLEAAEARAAARTPTEQEIDAALGQEAGRLLHAAREGAAEILAKAREEAARLVREATTEGAQAHEEAESLLARRTKEAEEMAAQVRAEAEREAEAQVDKAKAEGRAMVAEAQAVRERVLKDLVRRRRVAHQHLEQLRAGRERLLEAYRVVRSTLDEATRELSVAEVEARAAATTAALRAGGRPEPSVEELESELSAARDAGLTGARADSGGGLAAESSGNGTGAGAGENEPEAVGAVAPEEVAEVLADVVPPAPEVTDPVTEPGDSGADPVVDLVPEPDLMSDLDLDLVPEVADIPAQLLEPLPAVAEPVADEADVGAETAAPEADAADPVAEVAEVAEAGHADLEPVPAVAEPAAETAEPAAGGPEPAAEADDPGPGAPEPVAGAAPPRIAEPTEPTELTEPVDPVERVEPHRPPAASAPVTASSQPRPETEVERLFARIRADREAAVARAEAVLAGPLPKQQQVEPSIPAEARHVQAGQPPGVGPHEAALTNGDRPPAEAAPGAGAQAPDDAPADDEHVLQERDAQIEPLERVLLRSLKRALADEQNEVLDTLRRHRGPTTLTDLLPGRDDHVARYVAVATADLEAGAIQGARGAGGGEAPPVDDLATALGREVADDLRARLQRAVDAADGEEAPLRDAISSAYREWKTSWAEPLVRHHLATAHARGRFAALPAVPLRWVVDDDEGACPDCDDNTLAGPTPKGQPFPTGQEHPPAHVGCRCMVVPEPA